jgi:hypothetical protein
MRSPFSIGIEPVEQPDNIGLEQSLRTYALGDPMLAGYHAFLSAAMAAAAIGVGNVDAINSLGTTISTRALPCIGVIVSLIVSSLAFSYFRSPFARLWLLAIAAGATVCTLVSSGGESIFPAETLFRADSLLRDVPFPIRPLTLAVIYSSHWSLVLVYWLLTRSSSKQLSGAGPTPTSVATGMLSGLILVEYAATHTITFNALRVTIFACLTTLVVIRAGSDPVSMQAPLKLHLGPAMVTGFLGICFLITLHCANQLWFPASATYTLLLLVFVSLALLPLLGIYGDRVNEGCNPFWQFYVTLIAYAAIFSMCLRAFDLVPILSLHERLHLLSTLLVLASLLCLCRSLLQRLTRELRTLIYCALVLLIGGVYSLPKNRNDRVNTSHPFFGKVIGNDLSHAPVTNEIEVLFGTPDTHKTRVLALSTGVRLARACDEAYPMAAITVIGMDSACATFMQSTRSGNKYIWGDPPEAVRSHDCCYDVIITEAPSDYRMDGEIIRATTRLLATNGVFAYIINPSDGLWSRSFLAYRSVSTQLPRVDAYAFHMDRLWIVSVPPTPVRRLPMSSCRSLVEHSINLRTERTWSAPFFEILPDKGFSMIPLYEQSSPAFFISQFQRFGLSDADAFVFSRPARILLECGYAREAKELLKFGLRTSPCDGILLADALLYDKESVVSLDEAFEAVAKIDSAAAAAKALLENEDFASFDRVWDILATQNDSPANRVNE